MTAVDLLKLGAFILGAGLGVKLYLAYERAKGLVQDDEINKQKAKIDALMGRAVESKQQATDAREDWNDFVNRSRDVTNRDGKGD